MNQLAMDSVYIFPTSNRSTNPLQLPSETAAKPHTAAVVVAMAGTIRPATNFTCEQLWAAVSMKNAMFWLIKNMFFYSIKAWRILAFVKQTIIRASNDS